MRASSPCRVQGPGDEPVLDPVVATTPATGGVTATLGGAAYAATEFALEGLSDGVVVDLVGMDQPPLRFRLGAAAFDRIRAQLTTRLADLDAVEPLGRDTDFASEPAS